MGADVANSRAPSSPVPRVNSVRPIECTHSVATTVHTSEKTRTSVMPPTESSSAARTGYRTGTPEK